MSGTFYTGFQVLLRQAAGLQRLLLCCVLIATVNSSWAAEEDYETHIVLANTANTNGIDTIVFRWTGEDLNGDDKISKGELSYLEMELFAAAATQWYDIILNSDAAVPGVQNIACGGRSSIGDIEFEFDFVENKLVEYRNVYRPGNSNSCYMVSDDTSFPDINVYQATVAADIDWDSASAAAQSKKISPEGTDVFGRLATISSLEEDLYIGLNGSSTFAGLASPSAWLGGMQDKKGKEPAGGWQWINGEGLIPISVAVPTDGNYENWLAGTPDNFRGQEDYLAAVFSPAYGWNDEDKGIGGYITEFAVDPADVYVWLFVSGVLITSGEADEFEQFTFTDSSIRNIQTRAGSDQNVFNIPVFTLNSEEVAYSGNTSGDFCVFPDPREKVTNGGSRVFNRADLYLRDVSGGTCKGPLDFPDEEYETWEALIADLDLYIPANFRGYWGHKVIDGVEVKAVWLTLGIVRSTAEFGAPNVFVSFPENLINYDKNNYDGSPAGYNSGLPLEPIPECTNSLDWRPLDLGGNVTAFNEEPDEEGDMMILKTVQCNRGWGVTDRTTHVFPIRSDKGGASGGQLIDNIRNLFEGIEANLLAADFCGADGPWIAAMQNSLDDAERDFINKQYLSMVRSLEDIARTAYVHKTELSACDTLPNPDADEEGQVFNYSARLTGRGLAAAFIGWDRWLHPDIWELYIPAADETCIDTVDDPDTDDIIETVESCSWAYYGITKPDLRE